MCGKDGRKRGKVCQLFENRGAEVCAGQLSLVHVGMQWFLECPACEEHQGKKNAAEERVLLLKAQNCLIQKPLYFHKLFLLLKLLYLCQAREKLSDYPGSTDDF